MIKRLAILLSLISVVEVSWAGDIHWEGTYRFEALKVFNPSLSQGTDKSYVLHHLTLRPQFQAFDGLVIHSRFDVMNNSRFPNDQLGQTFGAGLNDPSTGPVAPGQNSPGSGTNGSNSNTLGDQQFRDLLAVNELYANWIHEFGVLTVGRAPMHFGLGMTFNAGYGLFDHWLENRDLIAYKFVLGNFTVMPVLAKSYEGVLDQEDDVNDFILQLNYENPESELQVGLIYQARRSTSNANSNDTPLPPFGSSITQQDNYEVDSYNVFVSQWVDKVKVAFEIGFMSGGTGLFANGTEIKHDAMGGALEVDWFPEGSPWGLELDLGYASGDDPTTANTYEGFVFDQNYDVAFLLFNHPMGSGDIFRSDYLRNTAISGATTRNSAGNSYDTEAVSNVLYASGAVHYIYDEKFDIQSRVTWAQLAKQPFANAGVDSDVGMEVDLSVKYEPFKGFQWINRGGVFFPGAAFKGGTNNFATETAYGFETKAAISF